MHVVITGANRGIGAEMDTQLRAQGHDVTGTSRSGNEGQQLEVTDPVSHAAMAHALDSRAIDLLVCNAGVYLDKGHNLADGYPAQMWAETFAANVTGVFLTVQSLLPNLQLSDAPKIAIMSSMMASDTRAPGGSYIYRSSKAAALNLGLNLAADLKHLGVAVGVYHPGWVSTDMGGETAPVTVQDSAKGLLHEFAKLSLETTGCFRTYDGMDHPY
jgi:NAD(P)-dependent dehydrogenase (short-subunit alcohol dehydrogenase family)